MHSFMHGARKCDEQNLSGRIFNRTLRAMQAAGLLALVLFALTPALHAQYRASLRGTVTDPSGAVVPDAHVTLTDKETGRVRTTTANASGVYTFNALPPNHFSLAVDHAGFQKKVISDLVIIPEQANELNVALEIGQVQQTVTVSGVTSALNTDTATVSATITSHQIQHMPSFDRNVFALAELAPGVFGDASQSGGGGSFSLPGTQGPGGPSTSASGIFATENGPQIQAQGGQYETNSISVDGISTVSAVWGGTSVITPSEDSIQSMKVVSNDYNAANGRFSGGQIEVTTKGGTNHLHGSFFFKASRPGLNAYQAWNGPSSATTSGTPAQRGLNRDQSRFNNYGGSLGGPIWKNRIFAFFNWESSPLVSSNTAQGWYETPQFDKLAAAPIATKYLTYPGEAPASPTLVPETCADIGLQQGVDCQAESGGLDVGSPLKTGVGYQDLTYGGTPSQPGVGGGLDGVPDIAYYTTVAPSTISQNQYNGRLDADVTHKDHLTFSLYWVPVDSTFYNGPARSANLWHHSQVNDAFTLLWLHTFSPTLINQARANAAGWRWNEIATNPQEPFGLPQDNIGNIGTASMGNSYFGAPGPSHFDQWTYTYSDTLTKTLGNMNINVGGELTRLYYLNDAVYAARPQFSFNNLWDFANDAPWAESGEFDSKTGVPFSNRQDDRENLWGFFVQDDWKLKPNLTINMGLRWSYFGSFHSKENNLDVLRFGTGTDPLTGLHVQVGGNLYNPPKTNFSPEIGFAWQPKMLESKLVFRGGFGINYNQNEIAITANGYGNPPNAVQPNFQCVYPYTSNPNCSGKGILYETASNIHSLFGYAPNPAAITNFDSNNLPLSGSIFITGFPHSPNTITAYHYSLGFEYQLPHDMVATLGYQGSATRNLITQYNYNVLAGAEGHALNPKVNYLDYYDNRATSNYNGMIATLTHNFAHGFQVEGQYTWAKSMDEGSGPYEEDPYPYDAHAAYGRSDYNVTNDFKLFGMWQPQFFHANSWLEKVAGGWTVSGIWNVHTGFPWTPYYSTTENVYYNTSGYGTLRPAANLGGYGRSLSNHDFEQAVNPNFGANATKYFTPPTYVAGATFPSFSPVPRPGIERNSLTGPGYSDLDGSLSKAFGLPNTRVLGDNAKLTIRADAYNLLNVVNLNPSGISGYLGSVSPSGVVTPSTTFGTETGGALGSRTVQLQARFSF